ncbi:hypothetical protein NFI96_028035, partial [Prochilodus magdalenae]
RCLMMLGSAQLRRRRAQDFAACYDSACAAQGSVPVPAVKSSLSQGVLDFNGDVISFPDWTPILSSLAINKHLQNVTIRSCFLSTLGSQASSKARKKAPVVHSKSMTLQLCKAVQTCLCVSSSLKTLQLQGLPLRERDLNILTKGLPKNTSLEHLSLARCPIADDGLEIICQSVKYSSTIRTVDFTSCNITWQGAEHMANIIKENGLAVDLQRCGISNEGAKVLEKMLQSNSTLCVLDIRRNPLVDNELVKNVIKKVLMNIKGQDSQYLWLKPPAKDARDHSGPTMRRNTGRATYRPGKKATLWSRRASSAACGWRPPRPGSAGYIPWRTAARAKLQRGLPQGAVTANQSFQNASTIRVTLESESEAESEEVEDVSQSLLVQSPQGHITSRKFRVLQAEYERLQVELEECKLRLTEEKNARLKANSRLVELELENSRLRSLNQSLSEAHVSHSVLEDEGVLDSIESSFHKFHAFLDLLKDAGLGQLASMAGIEQSDFGVLGHPQLSSTERRGQGDQSDEQRKEDTATTNDHQRVSRPPSNRSSSRVSAASRNSPHIQSHQEIPPTPTIRSSTPPALLDQRYASEQQPSISPVQTSLHRMSDSEKVQGSGGSKSASSASSINISIHSRTSHSYRDDFSEGKLSPALSSRSSSVARYEGQTSAAGLARF